MLAPDDPWHPWDNVNLVSECETGDLYAVAMGTTRNRSFLYRLDHASADGAELIALSYVAGRGLNTSGPLVSLRSGAGVHITPNGNLVSYVTNRRPDFVLEEFRYHGEHGD